MPVTALISLPVRLSIPQGVLRDDELVDVR